MGEEDGHWVIDINFEYDEDFFEWGPDMISSMAPRS